MSEVETIDPFAGLPADVPQEAAREAIAAIVKGNGVPIGKANEALAARGFQPLNANSQEYHQAQKEMLLNDSQFAAAYSAGNPEAIAKLYQADLKISQASGKLIDRPASASDAAYDPVRRVVAQNIPGPGADAYGVELAGLAASVGMPAANAQALVEDHFAAVTKTNAMDVDTLALWADQQAAVLISALGEDAEARLTAASKILSEKSGRKLDLAKIARSNGAGVAINLFFQSQSLAKGK